MIGSLVAGTYPNGNVRSCIPRVSMKLLWDRQDCEMKHRETHNKHVTVVANFSSSTSSGYGSAWPVLRVFNNNIYDLEREFLEQ